MILSYRLPRLRNWLTFYGDGYTDDQFSPDRLRRPISVARGALSFSRSTGSHKMDLRAEGVYTDVPPGGGPITPGDFYFNATWRSGYTNDGNMIGSWVGRGGQGAQAWSNYWFNARNRIQFNFRHREGQPGVRSRAGVRRPMSGVRGDYWVRSNLSVSASVQYERWLFPVIQPNACDQRVGDGSKSCFSRKNCFSVLPGMALPWHRCGRSGEAGRP